MLPPTHEFGHSTVAAMCLMPYLMSSESTGISGHVRARPHGDYDEDFMNHCFIFAIKMMFMEDLLFPCQLLMPPFESRGQDRHDAQRHLNPASAYLPLVSHYFDRY